MAYRASYNLVEVYDLAYHGQHKIKAVLNANRKLLSMSKVWFITGSSRGLGRALTEVVLESGYLVVATARKPEQLADLSKIYGDRVRTVKLDVTSPADAEKAWILGVGRDNASLVEAQDRAGVDMLDRRRPRGQSGRAECHRLP